MIEQYSTVDLFCGSGGLTHGFNLEGLKVVAGIDFDSTCKYSYENNNNSQFLHYDILKLSAKELQSLYPPNTYKILVGCAPCQPFSIFTKNKSKATSLEEDERWRLLYSFSNLIKETRPEIISMENVPLLKTFNQGIVFNDFIKPLKKIGYYLEYKVVNAQDYGVPQRRKRLVLLGSLLGPIEFIPPTHSNKFVTVAESIGHLPNLNAGEIDPHDPLHRSRSLRPLSKTRIKATPEGGSWVDWADNLKLECHKKPSGKPFGSVYGRMHRNEVAPTITTYCTGLNNGRFGHPVQDRAISLREAAILQSFPHDYKFIDPNKKVITGTLARHIGNAVPVLLGRAIAKSIKKHITKYSNVNR